MKKVYFDYNIFAFLQDKNTYSDLYKTHVSLKKYCLFPYSPAHMEEVATIYSQDRSKISDDEIANRIEKILQTISDISGNIEIRPLYESKPYYTVTEHPKDCFKRVTELYPLTTVAESIDKVFSYQANEQSQSEVGVYGGITFEDLRKKYNIEPKELGNIKPENLFEKENVVKFFLNHFNDFNNDMPSELKTIYPSMFLNKTIWDEIKNNFRLIEAIIEILMKGLYKIRYKADNKKKYRSSMHDITHAAYATSCDYFVTNDIKTGYLDRVSAVYNLLNVPTKVISMEDFLKLNSSSWVE